MPQTSKALFRGAASTTTVVTDIVVTNTAGAAGTFTILLNDVSIATTVSVGAYDSTVIPLKQVLATTQTIKGGASATTINLHISGVEIS